MAHGDLYMHDAVATGIEDCPQANPEVTSNNWISGARFGDSYGIRLGRLPLDESLLRGLKDRYRIV